MSASRRRLPSMEARAHELFRERQTEHLARTDRWLACLMVAEWLFGLVLVLFQEGDLLVLYTNAITEAMSSLNEQLGVDRLCQAVERLHDNPADLVRDRLLDELSRWASAPHGDDVTLLVLRHVGGTETRVNSGIQRRGRGLQATS